MMVGMTEATSPPPGWYQHPGDPTVMRHWDGQQWTGHTAPTGTVEAARPTTDQVALLEDVPPLLNPRSESHLVTVGVVSAILLPIVGLVIGIVLLFKNRVGPALGCILLSLLVMVVGYYVIQSLDDDPDDAAAESLAVDAGDDAPAASSEEACEAAADQAVQISADQGAAIALLKVRGLEVIKDNRSTVALPSGSDEATVLLCRGVGVWSDGDSATPVRIRVSVDADNELFIYYEPVA